MPTQNPCPKDIVPCGIKKYSPCPDYDIRTWRRDTACPNDYQQFIPTPGLEDCEEQPCRFAIYVGNENTITDDDMTVVFNGAGIATLIELDTSCTGTFCRGHLILPASLAPATPLIFGQGGPGLAICVGQPIALQYYYSAALDAPPPGLNTVQLATLTDNNCGNYGRFTVFQVCQFDDRIQLVPVKTGFYQSEVNVPLPPSTLQFEGKCLPCCEKENRQPAKGVKIHVLVPKVVVSEVPGFGKVKLAEDVASYEWYFDSHGKLDDVRFACSKPQLSVLITAECSNCNLETKSSSVRFAPGIFYVQGAGADLNCCE